VLIAQGAIDVPDLVLELESRRVVHEALGGGCHGLMLIDSIDAVNWAR